MARMMYFGDSTSLLKRMARRHIRLCGRVKGAEPFATQIQLYLNALLAAEQALLISIEQRENALDDTTLIDAKLDDAVRTLFERTKQHDRENNTNVVSLLFPNHTFSDIIRAPLQKEPQLVIQLILKLKTLDASHELYPQAALMQSKVDESEASLTALRQTKAIQNEKQVALELEKGKLRLQYEYNYLDARKQLVAAAAESIFPSINTRKPADEEVILEPETI